MSVHPWHDAVSGRDVLVVIYALGVLAALHLGRDMGAEQERARAQQAQRVLDDRVGRSLGIVGASGEHEGGREGEHDLHGVPGLSNQRPPRAGVGAGVGELASTRSRARTFLKSSLPRFVS